MSSFIDEVFSIVGGAIDHCGWADKVATKLVIDKLVGCAPTRPHPWSTASDYTSWKSLTDKTYQARQLPAADLVTVPAVDAVVALFKRSDGQQRMSDKSTCLFPAFAQYLTDGFIRTVQTDRAKTTSNHEIDLCPLYGRTEDQTNALRQPKPPPGQFGRLASQMIGSEEWSPYLYLPNGSGPDPRFAALDPPLGLKNASAGGKMTLFAIGGDRANSTPFTTMMNTLLLREHNRVAGELESRNPGWDDERVFQTARNIMIPMFINIVIEQYINHITPAPFNLMADPTVAYTANWNRPNWMTAEFSLLYRWHSLMPDAINWPTGSILLKDFVLDNGPLIKIGMEQAFVAASGQPSAELGAFNTGLALLMIEELAINQGRSNRLASYNCYRAAYGMDLAQNFSDISTNPKVADLLETIYGDVDKVEFYPGIFSEDRVDKSPLPALLLKMVGVDAFSQALTNPLLSEHVFNAATFTQWGLDLITQTHSLGDILKRQGMTETTAILMTQPTWHFGWHRP